MARGTSAVVSGHNPCWSVVSMTAHTAMTLINRSRSNSLKILLIVGAALQALRGEDCVGQVTIDCTRREQGFCATCAGGERMPVPDLRGRPVALPVAV